MGIPVAAIKYSELAGEAGVIKSVLLCRECKGSRYQRKVGDRWEAVPAAQIRI